MELTQAFTTLGLTSHATAGQAKVAYRALAMHWHPDVNHGTEAPARMKAINVAYEVVTAHLALREPVCDQPQPQPAATRAAPRAAGVDTGASGFSEFDWRTGFKATGGSFLDKPERRSVSVTLVEAAFGCVKRVKGSATDGWTLYVRIHPGTCEGAAVAQGDIRIYTALQTMPRAFELTVHIEKHPLFELDKHRLSVSVPMSVWRWIAGGEFTVPTVGGTVRVNLPARAGVVMFKDQGWPHFKQPSERHPLFVCPKRVYPKDLSEHEQRLLQSLDAQARLPEVDGWQLSLQDWAGSYATQGQT
jgi:curved DNA-binding protein